MEGPAKQVYKRSVSICLLAIPGPCLSVHPDTLGCCATGASLKLHTLLFCYSAMQWVLLSTHDPLNGEFHVIGNAVSLVTEKYC